MKRLWLVGSLLVACGGASGPGTSSSADPTALTPSNTAEDTPAPVVDSSEVEDIEPGELDRTELCERAIENVIRLLELRDPNEIEESRVAGLRDCQRSPATRDDLTCFVHALRVSDLSRCHETSNRSQAP